VWEVPGSWAGVVVAHNGSRSLDDAALEQRVYGLEQGFKSVLEQMAKDREHTDRRFDSILSKLDRKSEIPWAALSLLFVIIMAIGTTGVSYVTSGLTDIKASQTALDQKLALAPTRGELQDRWARNARDLDKLEGSMTDLRSTQVARTEHNQRWDAFSRDIANLQRQIDDNRKEYGQTYSIRDALTDLGKRLEKLERR
jgi:hypothetical protein